MEAQTKPVHPDAPLADTAAAIGDSATIDQLKSAISRCVDNAHKEHGDDSGPGDHAGNRARNFVARLSGSLESLGEMELAEKVFSILKRSDA